MLDNSMYRLLHEQSALATDDDALMPIEEALNDPSLSHAHRTDLVARYQDRMSARLPWTDIAWEAAGSDFPLSRSGFGPHLAESLDSPQFRMLLDSLNSRASSAPSDQLNIEELWGGVRDDAAALYGDGEVGPGTDLEALRAMALVQNARRVPIDGLDARQQDVLAQTERTYWAFRNSMNPEAAVQSRGAAPSAKGFPQERSDDHNFHFFSHAFVAADAVRERGLNIDEARAWSGFVGAQYEFRSEGLSEKGGNAALKDLMMNAEGAAFGASLMLDPSTPFPGMCSGPLLEDRSMGAPITAPTVIAQVADSKYNANDGTGRATEYTTDRVVDHRSVGDGT